jgi:hypothetical protein
MVDIVASVVATDICDPSPVVVLESITSNEPDDAPGGGDGHTTNDIQGAEIGTDDRAFQLRAERDGKGSGRIYTVTYSATDASGNSATASATVSVPHDQGGLKKGIAWYSEESVPEFYALFPNHPNPFNPETTIRYQLPEGSHVSLKIFNSMGREIRSLVDEKQQPGIYTARWDGRDDFGEQVSSGVYLYILHAGGFHQARKALLLR